MTTDLCREHRLDELSILFAQSLEDQGKDLKVIIIIIIMIIMMMMIIIIKQSVVVQMIW